MIADFAQSMEHRMRRGDRKGWVWNAVARHTADPHELIDRAIKNLMDARRAVAGGEGEYTEECCADAANLAMLTLSLVRSYGKTAGCWDGPDEVLDGLPVAVSAEDVNP
jgi:hypothetical protein